MTSFDHGWTDEQRALKQSAIAFTQREVTPHLDQWERDGELPRELQKKLAHAGLLGVGVPEEVGGDGGTLLDICAAQEGFMEAGWSGGAMASAFTHGIAIPHIIQNGSPELIDAWVRPTLAGDLIGSMAVTEPGTGSDVASITTRAVRDGDHWVINGAKTFITSSVRGDFVTTAVRTGEAGAHGISMIVVPKGTPGFTVSRKLDKMGWLASDTGELSYVDVRVPVGNLVGEENHGFYYIAENFVTERIFLALMGYGHALRCLNLSVQYCKDRETFGKPLVKNQVVRAKLVEMHRQVAIARTYTLEVAQRYVAGENVIAEACLAKQTAVDTAVWVADQAVQLHGGMGYMRESEVERHYRDVRLLPIGGGATEVLTDLAAKLLGYS
ncbi:acyl-CoA dehydrogenase [Pimelobacter simplex]|uniref:Isovaleryl-CoA dehydrogenase n=1 Tax=Nocardioides simplex TaxID=2045 RepID=A0A0A1DK06_NOCSI|nr:acyl-CoA dehydrogenase family protein [Pimelobacter simplex]AIY15690.1 Isovaleryl-CoA dehydrogenase [Pimelobacter simplex]MCG8150517.1 acyl-CoA dehydrogenase [Pimelobacter simplex]GEB15041.1 acyl-CoA dehydrogenase [Pimelobacter simplex]SFM87228.1 acyl-CoA dehydrogenase [Pimelobacter simplex]